MTAATRAFDAAHYTETASDQADLLSDAVDSGEPPYIAYALGAIARARNGSGTVTVTVPTASTGKPRSAG